MQRTLKRLIATVILGCALAFGVGALNNVVYQLVSGATELASQHGGTGG